MMGESTFLPWPDVTRLSAALWRPVEIDQGHQRHSERLGDPEQVQIRGIPASGFQAAYVRAIQAAFGRQLLLGPVFPDPKPADPLTEPSESGVWSGARRHALMVTRVHNVIYRPGSTRWRVPFTCFFERVVNS